MALDAIVGLIEGTGEVGTGIGELEAFTMTPVVARQLKFLDALVGDGFDFHEMQVIQLVRRFEEHALFMFGFAFGGECGPGGILGGQFEMTTVFFFRLEPLIHVTGEAHFGESLVHESFELDADGETVNLTGLFDSDAGNGFSLDETAFDGIEGCEFGMVGLQGAEFFFYAEELADEIFQVRSDGGDEFGGLFGGESGGILADDDEPGGEIRRGGTEVLYK